MAQYGIRERAVAGGEAERVQRYPFVTFGLAPWVRRNLKTMLLCFAAAVLVCTHDQNRFAVSKVGREKKKIMHDCNIRDQAGSGGLPQTICCCRCYSLDRPVRTRPLKLCRRRYAAEG